MIRATTLNRISNLQQRVTSRFISSTALIRNEVTLSKTNVETTESVKKSTFNILDLIPSSITQDIKPANVNPNSITIPALMAANVHLGSSTLHRAMIPYVYGERNGLNILNLEHTVVHLRRAVNVAKRVSMMNGLVLFVGKRKAIHKITVDSALKAGGYYTLGWTGGTLTNKERVLRRSIGNHSDRESQAKMETNFKIESSSEEDLNECDPESNAMAENDHLERASWKKPNALKSFGKDRKISVPTPDLIIILDYPNGLFAVKEANIMNIPVIAICDTDMNPNLVQYPIPANDDSISSVEMIASILAKACQEGHQLRGKILESRNGAKKK